LSLIGHADLVTSGMYIAKVAVTETCPVSKNQGSVSALWSWTMRESAVGLIGEVPFVTFALLGFGLMGMQGLYAVAMCVPLKARSVQDGGEREINYRVSSEFEAALTFDTCAAGSVDHGSIIQTLAEVNRMCSVTYQYPTYRYRMMEIDPVSAMELMGNDLVRAVLKFIAFSICQSAYQLNLQSSGLALARAANVHHQLDLQTLVSIGLAQVMALKNFQAEASTIYSLRTWIVNRKAPSWADNEIFTPEEFEWAEKGDQRSKRYAQCVYPLFIGLAALYVLLVLRGFVQTYFAIACPFGLHNIGIGCVEPPNELLPLP